jgi:hypothetical protein
MTPVLGIQCGMLDTAEGVVAYLVVLFYVFFFLAGRKP